MCVCPAFTVLGGKKTKKEGHHKEFLHIFSTINPRKGHRSVLPPVLAMAGVARVCGVCIHGVVCCCVGLNSPPVH